MEQSNSHLFEEATITESSALLVADDEATDIHSHRSQDASHKDGPDSDSDFEKFEDAMEGLELNSSDKTECHETRTSQNASEDENEELSDELSSKNSASKEDVNSTNVEIDEEVLKDLESKLTDEEKQNRKLESRRLKDLGNDLFKEGNYEGAIEHYSDALMACLLTDANDRAIIYSNRAAAYMKLQRNEEAIKDSSKALEYNPEYMKALIRRAELYERVEKLDEALEDYKKVLERDPSLRQARAACMRLPTQINERNEKLKTEMMGKLKDLGNLVLRPFGLSTDNFKLQQDPNTGSYSVSFQQSNR